MIRRKESLGVFGEIPGIDLQALACSDVPEAVVKANLARFHHLHFHIPQAVKGPWGSW